MKIGKFEFIVGCVLGALVLTGAARTSDKVLTVATTTSTLASGLLDVLLPVFEKDTGIKVKVVAKGTGAAIRDGQEGNVDLIIVHAKEREEAFVAEGYGTKRFAVMHNDFVILGPKNDPARIRGMKDGARALAKVARKKMPFTSRGDDSGTHTKEQDLWRGSGLPLDNQDIAVVKEGKKRGLKTRRPRGDWYYSIGQGMGKALTFADEKQTYILADRGTYLKYRYGKKPPIDLTVLVEGDPFLSNPYGVIPVNPKRHPHARYESALRFSKWLVSKKAQKIIEGYTLHGKQLFFPDAFPGNPGQP